MGLSSRRPASYVSIGRASTLSRMFLYGSPSVLNRVGLHIERMSAKLEEIAPVIRCQFLRTSVLALAVPALELHDIRDEDELFDEVLGNVGGAGALKQFSKLHLEGEDANMMVFSVQDYADQALISHDLLTGFVVPALKKAAPGLRVAVEFAQEGNADDIVLSEVDGRLVRYLPSVEDLRFTASLSV